MIVRDKWRDNEAGREVMPLSDQRAIVERHARQASMSVITFMARYQAQIEALALDRMTTLGFAQYGDATFRKTEHDLWQETMEELADAVVYRAVRIARDRGELG